MELPHVQQMYEELKDKGFGAVAITSDMSPKETADFVSYNHMTIPVAMDPGKHPVTTSYNAGNGTFVLLDNAGKVIFCGVYEPDKIREALARQPALRASVP